MAGATISAPEAIAGVRDEAPDMLGIAAYYRDDFALLEECTGQRNSLIARCRR
jgi:hypothetical protein